MKNPPFEKDDIVPWIGKTAKLIGYHITDKLREEGIDLSKDQFILLMYLRDEDGLQQKQLAFITNRSKTSLTRMINTLEKKGYVKRSSAEDDKRIKYIYLTSHGSDLLLKALPLVKKIIYALQDRVSIADLQTTRKVLHQIRLNIKNNQVPHTT